MALPHPSESGAATFRKSHMGARRFSRYSLIGSVFFPLSLCFLTLTCVDFGSSIKFVDVFIAAERLEAQKPISILASAHAEVLVDEIVKGNYCRSDIVLSGVTVALDAVDRVDPVAEYADWLRALSTAELSIKHALSCSPVNGNLWLRLAAVNSVIAESPKSLAHLMSLSASLAPFDEPVVLARLYFWNHFSTETLEKAQPVVLADLNLLLGSGDAKSVATALRYVNANLQPYVESVAASLPNKRKKVLSDAGFALRQR